MIGYLIIILVDLAFIAGIIYLLRENRRLNKAMDTLISNAYHQHQRHHYSIFDLTNTIPTTSK